MISIKKLLLEETDYDASWDYTVDSRPVKSVVRLIDYVIKDTKRLQKALGLKKIHVHFISREKNTMAIYIAGTGNNPHFAIPTWGLYRAAKKYGVNLGTAVEMSLVHEMGHAYLESIGIDPSEHDEDTVEEFARHFSDTRNVETSKMILDAFAQPYLSDV